MGTVRIVSEIKDDLKLFWEFCSTINQYLSHIVPEFNYFSIKYKQFPKKKLKLVASKLANLKILNKIIYIFTKIWPDFIFYKKKTTNS